MADVTISRSGCLISSSIHQSNINLSICFYQSIYLSIYLSSYLSIHLSIYPSNDFGIQRYSKYQGNPRWDEAKLRQYNALNIEYQSHSIHVWYIIYLHEWLIFMVNVEYHTWVLCKWDMKLKIHLMSPKARLLFFLLSFFFLIFHIFLLHLLFHPWPKYPPLVNQNKHENTGTTKKTSWILAEGCLRSFFGGAHHPTIPFSFNQHSN